MGRGGGEGWGRTVLRRSPWTGLGASCWLGSGGGAVGRKHGGEPVWADAQLSMKHGSYLSHVPSRLKVTSASILQLQVQPLPNGQELLVKIPLDMVAGLNT